MSVVATHCLGGPGKTLTFRAVEDKAFQLETTRGARTRTKHGRLKFNFPVGQDQGICSLFSALTDLNRTLNKQHM